MGRRRSLESGLAAPWASEIRERNLGGPNEALATGPLELIVEAIVAGEPAGTLTPDAVDLAPVADLAEEVLTIGQVVAGSAERVHDCELEVLPDGAVLVGLVARGSGEVDVEAYNMAVIRHSLRMRPAVDPKGPEVDLGAPPTGDREFQPVLDKQAPGSLVAINGRLRTEKGTTLDALVAVLATASTFDVDPDGLAVIDAADLTADVAEWARLPLDEVATAVETLTLRGAGVRAEVPRKWEVERRSHRMACRPFVAGDSGLILAPWCARATQFLLDSRLAEGRLLWPADHLSPALQADLVRLRQIGNRGLELDAAAAVDGVAAASLTNLDPKRARVLDVTIGGEIDLLLIDRFDRWWVCEVKDLQRGFSPGALGRSVEKYLGRKGFIAKLNARVQEVATCAEALGHAMGVQRPEVPDVRGVFVTRGVEPCAFLADPQALHVLVDDLPALLADPSPPRVGQYAIGDRWIGW
jgi:hypothetical protein